MLKWLDFKLAKQSSLVLDVYVLKIMRLILWLKIQ